MIMIQRIVELLLLCSFFYHCKKGAAWDSPQKNSRLNQAFAPSPKTSTSTGGTSRKKRVQKLQEWAKNSAGIQFSRESLSIQASKENAGLGLILQGNNGVEAGNVVVTVPASLALSIELPRVGPDDASVMKALVIDRGAFRSLPWYVQFSLYLHKLDKISSMKQDGSMDGSTDLRPWLDSLPRKFNTPIHWSSQARMDWLQYVHMEESVKRQESSWKDWYQALKSCTNSEVKRMTWDDFVWGCESARSRAFSGGYTGAPFNPYIYLYALALVITYVGLNLGTLEDASNGAALVVCGSVLRDFVLPKFFRNQKYVICPVIDMCNHSSIDTSANVAYEFFANCYSLATISTVPANTELHINYGSRSNDQLLQYYGFVEIDNPHDIYVMPPLREWNIAALENACGGPFASGRLQKLDIAGLLGKPVPDVAISVRTEQNSLSIENSSSEGNPRGGVVLSRSGGIDPAVIQALRVLVSTDQEWKEAGESIGNFSSQINLENERKARLAARTALELEVASKPTTLDEDRELLKEYSVSSNSVSSKSVLMKDEEFIGLIFRMEKKKLLLSTVELLR